MSFEAVSNIKKAEEDAERLVAEAETLARQIISDAENSGRAKKEAAEKEMLKRIADGEDLYDILDYEESLKKIGVKFL